VPVAFVLVLSFERGVPLVSLALPAGISLYLWRVWVGKGKPGRVARCRRRARRRGW
jgi:hypothetical protein